MTPDEFIRKWSATELKERSASQPHFIDLCRLLGVDDPISVDGKGDWYTFEKRSGIIGGGDGWADVWRKGKRSVGEIKLPCPDLMRVESSSDLRLPFQAAGELHCQSARTDRCASPRTQTSLGRLGGGRLPEP
jgi:hypothetical protein